MGWLLGSLVGWSFGRLVGWLLGCLVAWWLGSLVCFVGWMVVAWLIVWLVGLLVPWLLGCLFGLLVGSFVGWLVGWSAGRFICWLLCCLVGWLLCCLVCWLLGGLVGWLLGWLLGCLVCWSIGRLVCWLVGSLVGWLVGWLVGLLVIWFFGCLVGCLVGWMVGYYQIHLTDNYVIHLPTSDTRSYTLIRVHIKHANIKPMRPPQPQPQPPTTTANKWTNYISGKSLFDQGHFQLLWSSGGTREATIWCLTVCKTTGVNSYTHQNGKVEGETVGNRDSLLEWKTIHVGTCTQRCRSKACRVGEIVVDPAPDLSVGGEEGGVGYVSTHHIPPCPTSIKESDKCSE